MVQLYGNYVAFLAVESNNKLRRAAGSTPHTMFLEYHPRNNYREEKYGSLLGIIFIDILFYFISM